MSEVRQCKRCQLKFLLNKNNFGHQNSGFRYVCRNCMRAATAAHTKENPDMASKRYLTRRARQQRSAIKYDKDIVRAQLLIRQKHLCYYCKKALSGLGDLDHMHPIAQGGADAVENLTLACYQCNKEKHSKNVDEYRQWLIKNNYKPLF